MRKKLFVYLLGLDLVASLLPFYHETASATAILKPEQGMNGDFVWDRKTGKVVEINGNNKDADWMIDVKRPQKIRWVVETVINQDAFSLFVNGIRVVPASVEYVQGQSNAEESVRTEDQIVRVTYLLDLAAGKTFFSVVSSLSYNPADVTDRNRYGGAWYRISPTVVTIPEPPSWTVAAVGFSLIVLVFIGRKFHGRAEVIKSNRDRLSW